MKNALAVTLAGLLALALVACSSGDDDAPRTPSGDASASSGAAAESTPARPIDRGPYGGLVAGEAAPEFVGTQEWFNSEPLTLEGLIGAGQVVLVDFWTYSCVNCQRTLPYVRE